MAVGGVKTDTVNFAEYNARIYSGGILIIVAAVQFVALPLFKTVRHSLVYLYKNIILHERR